MGGVKKMIKKDGNIVQVLDGKKIIVQVLETKKIIIVSDACGREVVYKKTVCPADVWDRLTAIKNRGRKKSAGKNCDIRKALYRFTQTLYNDDCNLRQLSEASVNKRIEKWIEKNF